MSDLESWRSKPPRLKELAQIVEGNGIPDTRAPRMLEIKSKPIAADLDSTPEEIEYQDRRAAMRKKILINGLGSEPTEEELACLDPCVETRSEWNKEFRVDYKALYHLARIGSSVEEIRAMMGIPTWMLEQRLKVVIDAGKAQGRVAIRKAQFRNAIAGDSKMQIWLGKQYLGQTERAVISNALTPDIEAQIESAFATVIEDVDVEEENVRPVEILPINAGAIIHSPKKAVEQKEQPASNSGSGAGSRADDDPDSEYAPNIIWQ